MTDHQREKLVYIQQHIRSLIGDMVRADNFELFHRRAGEVHGYLSALAIEQVVRDEGVLAAMRSEYQAAKENKRQLLAEGLSSAPTDRVVNVTEEEFDAAARRLLGELYNRMVERGCQRSNICDAIARYAMTGTTLQDDPEALEVIKEAAYGFWIGHRPTSDDLDYLCQLHGE